MKDKKAGKKMKSNPTPFLNGHNDNYRTLIRAIENQRTCLLECTDTKTGEKVAVVCAYNITESGKYDFVPIAQMFNDNPYERLSPPEDTNKTKGGN